MTAGKGIMHSEMPYFDNPDDPTPVEGMQLWIDLPKDQKFCEPSYQEKKAKE
jgi:redox-sensitive bicupin YhaK (pirin superfamily)